MGMDDTISLHSVLQIIDGFDADDNPNVFSVGFETYDKKKQTGGRLINAEKCVKVVGKKNGKIIWPTKPKLQDDKLSRDPNHFKHQTRNILVNGTQNMRKLHIRLITRFNGKVVSWG